MATPIQTFKSKLGIRANGLQGKGYNYVPTIMQQGQTAESIGQSVLDKLGARKDAGQNIYTGNRQEGTNRLATDLVNKSAGLKFDEFGKPNLNLANFGDDANSRIKSVTERGNLALQSQQAKSAFKQAVNLQNVGSYGFNGGASVADGSVIPGASSGNKGAQAAAMAMKVAKNNTAYVWGGNSLQNGVDCSGLVQQIYKRLGISVPRVTYQQAKNGKQIPVSQIRPGDLVFYNNLGHVGIYIGNGKVVHAANPKLGVITSNLNNSNGSPNLVLRPY